MPVTRALTLDRPGAAPTVGTIDLDPPGPGEALLEVAACGLNPVDWKLALTGVSDWAWPHVPGLDIVGRVMDVGPTVSTSWMGRTVAVHHDLRRQGGLAERAVISAQALAPVPEGMDPVTAAGVPCPGLTADQAVQRTGIGPGDHVLICGAGGGVGTFAVQLAVAAGAEVTALARVEQEPELLALGAGAVVDHRAVDVTEQLRACSGGAGFDVAIDTVSSESAARAVSVLRYMGRLAAVAGLPNGDAVAPFTVSPTVAEISLGAVYSWGSSSQVVALADALGRLLLDVRAGVLRPPPCSSVPLERASHALQDLQQGRLRGKVVVEPWPRTG